MIVAIDPGRIGEAEHVAHTVPGVLGLDPERHPGATVSTHAVGPMGDRHHVVVVAIPLPGIEATLDTITASVLGRFPGAAVIVSAEGDDDATVTGAPADDPNLWAAVAQASMRSAGRLVAYPGMGRLVGRMPADRVSELSAVDELRAVDGTPIHESAVLDTRDFVRPVWEGGRAVLVVERSADGTLRPFEAEHQRACCEVHALQPSADAPA